MRRDAEAAALKVIKTGKAPAAVGPYSQAIEHNGILYCSGAIPLEPASGELVSGPIGVQTARCLANLDAVCEAAGTSLARAVQVTIYATRLESFAEINAAYAEYFARYDHLPARVTVGVAALPMGAEVELSALVAI